MAELADEQNEANGRRQNGIAVQPEPSLSHDEMELLSRGFEHYTFQGDQISDVRLTDDGRSLWLRFRKADDA